MNKLLNSFNGWQRLWLVVSVFSYVAMLIAGFVNPGGDPPLLILILATVICGIGSLALYLVGLSLAWIIKGFTGGKDV